MSKQSNQRYRKELAEKGVSSKSNFQDDYEDFYEQDDVYEDDDLMDDYMDRYDD